MSEKNKNILIIVFGIAFLAGFIVYSVLNKVEEHDVKRVSNASMFYTVEGCVNTYINALYNKNYDDVITLLDDKYEKKNDITVNNVSDTLGKIPYTTFSAKKIYEEVENKNINRYYAYGKVMEDVMDGYSRGEDYYIIIEINKDDYTFSVTPSSKSEFEVIESE